MRRRTDLQKNPVEGFSAGLVEDSNVFEWEILVLGPPETPLFVASANCCCVVTFVGCGKSFVRRCGTVWHRVASADMLRHARSEGGFFKARMRFPKDYPNMPPELRFTSKIWHPNGARCCLCAHGSTRVAWCCVPVS